MKIRMRDVKFDSDGRKLSNDEEVTPFSATGTVYTDGSASEDPIIIQAIPA